MCFFMRRVYVLLSLIFFGCRTEKSTFYHRRFSSLFFIATFLFSSASCCCFFGAIVVGGGAVAEFCFFCNAKIRCFSSHLFRFVFVVHIYAMGSLRLLYVANRACGCVHCVLNFFLRCLFVCLLKESEKELNYCHFGITILIASHIATENTFTISHRTHTTWTHTHIIISRKFVYSLYLICRCVYWAWTKMLTYIDCVPIVGAIERLKKTLRVNSASTHNTYETIFRFVV